MCRLFVVSCGDNYYPAGGPDDIAGVFIEMEPALNFLAENATEDWCQLHVLEPGKKPEELAYISRTADYRHPSFINKKFFVTPTKEGETYGIERKQV